MSESVRRPRILVVEDEWMIAADIESMLESMDCDVIGPTPRIDSALRLIAAELPDAALLDVSLGKTSSFPIAEVLMARGAPFLFLTGYRDADLPAPFNRCTMLSKPISPAAMREAVEALLATRPPALPPPDVTTSAG